MQFSPDMCDMILAGRKTRTTRPQRIVGWQMTTPFYEHECRYVVGRTYAVCPGRGKKQVARIRVTAVEDVASIHKIVDKEQHWALEGCDSWNGFLYKWTQLYPLSDRRRLGPVWMIDFEL